MQTPNPTKEELEKVFHVVDGKLFRRGFIDTRNRFHPRTEIKLTANHNAGYCAVRFKKRPILYHRIFWIMTNGEIPNGMEIDHINGNKIDNRMENLRLVTRRKNSQNKSIHRSGRLVGCSFFKRDKKWRAVIEINGKQKHLGLFATEQEAHNAYLKSVKEHDAQINH